MSDNVINFPNPDRLEGEKGGRRNKGNVFQLGLGSTRLYNISKPSFHPNALPFDLFFDS